MLSGPHGYPPPDAIWSAWLSASVADRAPHGYPPRSLTAPRMAFRRRRLSGRKYRAKLLFFFHICKRARIFLHFFCLFMPFFVLSSSGLSAFSGIACRSFFLFCSPHVVTLFILHLHLVHRTPSLCTPYTVALYSVHRHFVLCTPSLCAFLLSGAFRILQKIHFLNFSVPRNLHNSKIFCIFAPIFESLKGRNSTFVMGSFFLS